jgi:hypothetical protein
MLVSPPAKPGLTLLNDFRRDICSVEHHAALALAKTCERAAQSGDAEMMASACQQAIQTFFDEMEPHFQFEERERFPVIESLFP